MTLYIFNPEHDYALANNDPHFMAPASAVRFATDCALFLRHIVPEESFIFIPHSESQRFYSVTAQQFMGIPTDIQRIQPWGWDPLVLRQCQEVFPDFAAIGPAVASNVHRLAHRRNTIDAMEFLHQHAPENLPFPETASELFTTAEMEAYVREHQNVIFKSPYSGNGRGHLYAHGHCSPTLLRQGGGVIRRQGSIMAEPLYNVVQDFAMEFHCQRGNTSFCGYSLFNTRHYGYAGNLLLADNLIEGKLSQWISTVHLYAVRDTLLQYLNQHIAPVYDGYLGVDMFFYEQANQIHLNPMVEINLRMTMGMAAHILTEKHLHPESTGTMQLEYDPTPGGLRRRMETQPPMATKEGRWHHGVLALNPVSKETQYAITVNITNQQNY